MDPEPLLGPSSGMLSHLRIGGKAIAVYGVGPDLQPRGSVLKATRGVEQMIWKILAQAGQPMARRRKALRQAGEEIRALVERQPE